MVASTGDVEWCPAVFIALVDEVRVGSEERPDRLGVLARDLIVDLGSGGYERAEHRREHGEQREELTDDIR